MRGGRRDPLRGGVRDHPRCGDDPGAISGLLDRAAADNDVILSGGVSEDELDLVQGALEAGGFRLLFDRIATKPGKPTVFGVRGDACCFGLPGNPVSAFVIFEVLVKPFLYATMGHAFAPPVVRATLETGCARKGAERQAWLPVVFTAAGGGRPAGVPRVRGFRGPQQGRRARHDSPRARRASGRSAGRCTTLVTGASTTSGSR